MALTQISTAGVKDDAISAGKIPANAVGSSEIADDAVDQGAIADEAVDEARLQISNAGSNGQFLTKQSGNTGGLTWADGASEGTEVKSTGESGTAKFLRVDGDGTCSWQVPPDNNTVYTHPNHSGEVTSTGDGAQVIASNVVDEDNLKVDNSPTNDHVLTAKSGAAGGLTWAAVPAGGNSIDLVADGAIAAGKPCIITTAGKAKQAGLESTTLTTPTFDGSSSIGTGSHGCNQWVTEAVDIAGAWGRTTSSALLVYRDAAPNPDILEGAMVSPTTSATCSNNVDSVTMINTWPSTSHQNWKWNDMAYDITNNKFVVAGIIDSGNKAAFIYVTPNSSSSFSGTNYYTLLLDDSSNWDEERMPKVVYVGSGRMCFFYSHKYSGGNEKVTARIGTWNGSNGYTLGSEVTMCDTVRFYSATWHEDSGKVVFFGQQQDGSTLTSPNIGAGEGFFMVGTISGTGSDATISFATHVALPDNKSVSHTDIITDDSTDKIVAIGKPSNGSSFTSWVCSLSGTTLTVGSGVSITSSNISDTWQNNPSIVYHDMTQKVLAWYSSSDEQSHYVKIGTVSTSSNTITWANQTQWASSNNMNRIVPVVCYGDSSGTVLVNYRWENGGGDGKTRQFKYISEATNITTSSSNSVLNYTNILGFAEDAISDGNTGTIKLPGNVVGNQSGLTAGTYYYHKDDGTLATSGDSDIYKAKAGIAVSSSKLVIADPNQQS